MAGELPRDILRIIDQYINCGCLNADPIVSYPHDIPDLLNQPMTILQVEDLYWHFSVFDECLLKDFARLLPSMTLKAMRFKPMRCLDQNFVLWLLRVGLEKDVFLDRMYKWVWVYTARCYSLGDDVVQAWREWSGDDTFDAYQVLRAKSLGPLVRPRMPFLSGAYLNPTYLNTMLQLDDNQGVEKLFPFRDIIKMELSRDNTLHADLHWLIE